MPSFDDLRFDDYGRLINVTTTRSNRSLNQTQVQIAPTKAIPVIFIPGIMGSPLRAHGTNGNLVRRNSPWAWFPDSGAGWVAGITPGYTGFRNLTGAQRRVLLNPEQTSALTPTDNDIDEDIVSGIKKSLILQKNKLSANVYAMSEQEGLRRGWATVFWSGYGGILSYLEKYLRHITYSADPYSEEIVALGDKVTVFDSIKNAFNTVIKEENRRFNTVLRKDFPGVNAGNATSYKNYIEQLRPILKTGRQYHYPVFAAGYNWVRCNEDSATKIQQRITGQILPHVRNTLGYTCDDGIIIVTHSMGGLVARSLVKNFPNLNILGVIHGVQPCNGAATLYARMWAGWEGGKHFYNAMDNIAGRSLGRTRAELLPILTQSPGAMELSPNQNYASGWLRIHDHNNNRLLKTLPVSDPYSEIYLQTSNWLRLGSFAQMDPAAARDASRLQRTENNYREVIRTAKIFHQKIDNFFHSNTYLMYGQFNNYRTWGAVNLRVERVEFYEDTIYDESGGEHKITGRRTTRDPVPMAVVESAVCNAIPQRESGRVDITHNGQTYQVHMVGGNEPGDGTVPYNSANPWKAVNNPWNEQNWNNAYRSGSTPGNIQYIFEFTRNDYEHSESYNAEISQNVTFYSIMSVIKNKLS